MRGRLLALGLGLSASVLAAAGLSPAAERGKRLYLQGEGTGSVVALLGEGSNEVPGTALPCGGCHGRDGRGRPEGGVTPSPVTWEALARPGREPDGSERPPYTLHLLKRAITLGLDPLGRPLAAAMPRYRLSAADLADLTAYLERLGSELDPGVSAGTVRVGTLLPPGRPGEAVRALLAAYFAEVNRAGGIYGRTIELRAVQPAGSAAERRAALAGLLAGDGAVFALVAPTLGGANAPLAALLAEREVPAVGALHPDPPLASPPERYLFYLVSGLSDQARALADFAARTLPGGPTAVVAEDDPGLTPAVAAWGEACRARGVDGGQERRYPKGALPAERLAAELRAAGVVRLFFAGPGRDEVALLAAAAARGWHPQVLALGPLAGPEIFALPAGGSRLFLALPSLPIDLASPAAAAYRKLVEEHALAAADRRIQFEALAAARLFVAALEQTGRDLSREGLVDQLEAIRNLETGFTPPLSYAPGRRIAARGAYVVELDLDRQAFAPAGGWIEVH